MLTYKVNLDKKEPVFSEIKDSGEIIGNDTELTINYIVEPDETGDYKGAPSIKVGDTIVFSRVDGDDVNFVEEKTVSAITKDSFTVENFGLMPLDVKSVFSGVTRYSPNISNTKKYLYFCTEEQHFIFNNGVKITEFIPEVYKPEEYELCPNGYVLYNNNFIYQVNENDRHVFNEEFLNKKDGQIVIIPNEDLKNYFEEEKEQIILKNCITPSLSDGRDNRNLLLWEITDEKLANKIEENASELIFYVKDDRFMVEIEEAKNGALKYKIKDNVKIEKKDYTIKIAEAISQNFATNLFQEHLLKNDYVEEIKNKYKNKIIDYEKQVFEPAYYGGEGEEISDIFEIDFNLNFRVRQEPTAVTVNENYTLYDYGEWKVDESKYWYNYNPQKSKTIAKQSDLLGYLGFTDEDVFYRKKKISKSFIRLSFYDTTSRATQKLLFTSTIFLKDGDLYSNYIKNLRNNIDMTNSGYTYNEATPYRLDSAFKCKGKFSNEISNNYNSNASSEGYYIYLYPSLLKERDDEGNPYTTIYMKIEFNHAKYGYTIPFIAADINKSGQIVKPKLNYTATKKIEQKTYSYIDVSALLKDMYIPIVMKFDKNANRYIWYPQNNQLIDNDKGIITFQLFEPKINE